MQFIGICKNITLQGANEPQKGPLNNAGDDEEDDDNDRFWRALKELYIDEPDDNLLDTIVENGHFNEYLRLIAREKVSAALCKKVFALVKL